MDRSPLEAGSSTAADRPRAPLPPVLFGVVLLAAWLLERLVPLPLPLSFRARITAGLFVMIVAASLGAAALYEMWTARTPVEPNSLPRALVTTGPFCLSRNPLYVALVTVTTGIALILGFGWLLSGAAALAVALNFRVIPVEEKILDARFPGEFREYCRKVRRWL